MQIKYRPDIDGLRALAVVPVVLSHAGAIGFTGGFVGVDIFFVISGYLITKIINTELVEGRFSILNFYERRARRILPALFAVLFFCFIAGWFILVPRDFSRMAQSEVSVVLFFSNFWFWQNSGGYFDGATHYLPLLHTWSLAVEEQFYILFPGLLWLLHKFAKRSVVFWTMTMVLCSFVASVWATPRVPDVAFYLLPTRIWELGFGALLALGIGPIVLSRGPREILSATGLVLILLSVFFYTGSMTFPGLAALPPVLGATLIILAGSCGSSSVGRVLSSRPVVFIGLLSYSLYLWHWPVMAFLRNRMRTTELEFPEQVGTILVSLLAAYLSWRFVERPFRSKHRKSFTSRQIFRGSVIGMAGLIAASWGVVHTSGVTQRFSEEQLALIAANDVIFEPGIDCYGARPTTDLCVLGDVEGQDPTSWLLWGDSHAGAVLPLISKIAKQQNRKLFFANSGGCPPLIGTSQTRYSIAKNARCEEFNRSILNFIGSDQLFETVILAARWPIYVEGTGFASEGVSDFTMQADDTSGSDAFRNSLLRINDDVSKTSARLFILPSAPEIPWNVQDKLESLILFNRPMPAPPNMHDVLLRQSNSNAVLQEMGKLPNVEFHPIIEKICTPLCPTHEGFSGHYMDNNHLTASGADLLLGPILSQELTVAPDFANLPVGH